MHLNNLKLYQSVIHLLIYNKPNMPYMNHCESHVVNPRFGMMLVIFPIFIHIVFAFFKLTLLILCYPNNVLLAIGQCWSDQDSLFTVFTLKLRKK